MVIEAPINSLISVQAEAFYSGQGFGDNHEDDGDFGLDNDIEFKVGYIQVPVLVKFNIVSGLSVMGGPQVGFKVHEEIDINPYDVGDQYETDAFEYIDFQLTGGAEFKFNNGFFVQARATYGVSEVIEDSELHNFVFSTGGGFMF